MKESDMIKVAYESICNASKIIHSGMDKSDILISESHLRLAVKVTVLREIAKQNKVPTSNYLVNLLSDANISNDAPIYGTAYLLDANESDFDYEKISHIFQVARDWIISTIPEHGVFYEN
jgi:hypothetical protein